MNTCTGTYTILVHVVSCVIIGMLFVVSTVLGGSDWPVALQFSI